MFLLWLSRSLDSRHWEPLMTPLTVVTCIHPPVFACVYLCFPFSPPSRQEMMDKEQRTENKAGMQVRPSFVSGAGFPHSCVNLTFLFLPWSGTWWQCHCPQSCSNTPVWREVWLLPLLCFCNACCPAAVVTPAEVTYWLQTRDFVLFFLFAWSGEPFFRNDKHMLAAPHCFLAPGRRWAPGNTGSFGGWRSSSAHRLMHYAAPRRTGFLLASPPSGGMLMMELALPTLYSFEEALLASIT